jgi:hypothetical protein
VRVENDSIRASGNDTLVDIWIDGKMRSICLSQEAIGAFLGFDRASNMTEDDRCEFVRAHLPVVVNAAKTRLVSDPGASEILIDAGHLPRSDGRAGERRNVDRRKTERRKTDRPSAVPSGGDRRRGDRRKSERRQPRKDGRK